MASSLQQYLVVEFGRRKKRNARYSVRSFARDLEMDATALSRILAGTRAIGPKIAGRILKLLKMDAGTRETLLRSLIAPEDHGVPMDSEYFEITAEHLEQMDDWIYSAIVELAHSRGLAMPAIARYFGIPPVEAEHRIDRLVELELLKRTEKGFRKVHHRSTTPFRKNSPALRKILLGYMERAQEALIQHAEEDHDISGMTVLISKAKLPEASRRIKEFRRSLAHFLAAETGEELYRLNIQLFPLKKAR